MRRTICPAVCGFLVALIALFPISSGAIFPVAMFGKQILQNIIFGQVKDQMIGSLANMGCKGAHLAGVIASATAGRNLGGGLPGGISGAMPGGMGGMPGGGAMPGGGTNMPGGMSLPNGPNSPVKGASMRAARGGVGILNVSPEQAQAMMRNGTPDMAAIMAQMPGGQGMSPEQAAQVQQSMASMQEAMSHPLSRAETLEVFDEMASLGLLTNEMHSEVRDCIALAPPGDNSIGTAGAMMKNMVLPQLRDVKQRMSNLTPEEQNQLADGIVEGLKEVSPKDRKVFLDGFGAGFYPAPVIATVHAKMGKH